MTFRLYENGPFGCIIERGKSGDFEEIPEGYIISKIDVGDEMIVYIDPVKNLLEEIKE
jgi:hypothetical protein